MSPVRLFGGLIVLCASTTANLAHAEDYQKVADATAWKFSQEQAGVADSLLLQGLSS